jgi:hypothetical protein
VAVKSKIVEVFQLVAGEQRRKLAPLSDDLKLVDSGLDSLSMALVVAHLDDAFNVNPFDTAESFPVTFRDFVSMYENSTRA